MPGRPGQVYFPFEYYTFLAYLNTGQIPEQEASFSYYSSYIHIAHPQTKIMPELIKNLFTVEGVLIKTPSLDQER